MNVIQQANDNWSSICDDNLKFNSRERLMAALEAVTPEIVNAKFNELFFDNSRRLNVKLYS